MEILKKHIGSTFSMPKTNEKIILTNDLDKKLLKEISKVAPTLFESNKNKKL